MEYQNRQQTKTYVDSVKLNYSKKLNNCSLSNEIEKELIRIAELTRTKRFCLTVKEKRCVSLIEEKLEYAVLHYGHTYTKVSTHEFSSHMYSLDFNVNKIRAYFTKSKFHIRVNNDIIIVSCDEPSMKEALELL